MSFAELEYPLNPILCRLTRGSSVESVHRGAWCLVDSSGRVLEAEGQIEQAYFVRSSIKAIQALPLLETGAAERFGFDESELAITLASHSGEACHTELVRKTLERLHLAPSNLLCGAHAPNDPGTRKELLLAEQKPSALHNNCSGKHMGFLALAKHLGAALETYLEPDGPGQLLVRSALCHLTDLKPTELRYGVDGCSAPTYSMPLFKLAMAFARIGDPGPLGEPRASHLRRLTNAAAAHPELIAGHHQRIDSDLLRASGGRLFAKIGAEAVHVVSVVGGDRALALKIDDGGMRAQHCVLMSLLERLGLLQGLGELPALLRWSEPRLRNHAGLEVGRIEPVFSN